MKDYQSISIAFRQGKSVEIVHNPTSYPLIGMGEQGAVFKISDERCVKIYAKPVFAKNESKVLQAAQTSNIVPRIYEVGDNYVVMEYLDGPSLDQYLKSNGKLPEKITKQLLFMLKEMKRLNFIRLDASLRHIFVTKQDELKVIDHVNSFKISSTYPVRLLKDLKKLGYLSTFLQQVKSLDPASYQQWKREKK